MLVFQSNTRVNAPAPVLGAGQLTEAQIAYYKNIEKSKNAHLDVTSTLGLISVSQIDFAKGVNGLLKDGRENRPEFYNANAKSFDFSPLRSSEEQASFANHFSDLSGLQGQLRLSNDEAVVVAFVLAKYDLNLNLPEIYDKGDYQCPTATCALAIMLLKNVGLGEIISNFIGKSATAKAAFFDKIIGQNGAYDLLKASVIHAYERMKTGWPTAQAQPGAKDGFFASAISTVQGWFYRDRDQESREQTQDFIERKKKEDEPA